MSLCSHETIVELLATKVGVPATTPNVIYASWEELGVESLALAEVLASLQHTIEVPVSLHEILQTKNVDELVKLVNQIAVVY